MSMRQGNSTQRLYSCWQVPAKQHILCVEFWAVVLRFEHGCLFVGYPWCLPTDFCQQFCRRIRFIFNMFTVTVVLISQHLHISLLADLDDFQCPKNLKKKSLTSHSLRSAFYFLTLFFRLWSSLFFLPLRHSRHQQYYSELYLSRYLSKPEISAKRSKLSFLILPWVHLNNCGKRLKRETFCIGNSTISSAIWKKKNTHKRVFQRPQNSTSPKDECYLWRLKNPWVRVFFQISREIMLLLINNVHEIIWAMHLTSGFAVLHPFLATLAV